MFPAWIHKTSKRKSRINGWMCMCMCVRGNELEKKNTERKYVRDENDYQPKTVHVCWIVISSVLGELPNVGSESNFIEFSYAMDVNCRFRPFLLHRMRLLVFLFAAPWSIHSTSRFVRILTREHTKYLAIKQCSAFAAVTNSKSKSGLAEHQKCVSHTFCRLPCQYSTIFVWIWIWIGFEVVRFYFSTARKSGNRIQINASPITGNGSGRFPSRNTDNISRIRICSLYLPSILHTIFLVDVRFFFSLSAIISPKNIMFSTGHVFTWMHTDAIPMHMPHAKRWSRVSEVE